MKTWNIEIATSGSKGRWIACGDITAENWDYALDAARSKAKSLMLSGEKVSDCIVSRFVAGRKGGAQ